MIYMEETISIEQEKSEIFDEMEIKVRHGSLRQNLIIIVDDKEDDDSDKEKPEKPEEKKSLWITDIEYKEPNEFEKKMLEGTYTPQELLLKEQQEKEEKKKEDEIEKYKRDISTKLKVIANHTLGYHPLNNPSLISKEKKQELLEMMIHLRDNFSYDDITTQFNEICREKLFSSSVDYSMFPIDMNLALKSE